MEEEEGFIQETNETKDRQNKVFVLRDICGLMGVFVFMKKAFVEMNILEMGILCIDRGDFDFT